MSFSVLPDVSSQLPDIDYRYANQRGFPFAGQAPLMRDVDYMRNTRTTVRVGFGNYDTAYPEQQHSNRTLAEVMSRALAGEYKVLLHMQQFVTCPKFGVRVLYFVQWAEYYDRLVGDAVETANFKTMAPNSR